jgi:electron transfer flavoprotein alpha subunit
MSNVEALDPEGGTLRVESLMFGGGAVRSQSAADVSIIIVGGGFFPAEERAVADSPVLIQEGKPVSSGARLVERRTRETESVDLTAAKQVVSIGRGIAKKEDIAIAADLAKAVGGELACTRPIAEGENWLPRERYIGVSGAVLKPDIYWAVGISGQIQHMVGVAGAKTIVAVNKDKNAPIFKQCDYGIVGDLYKVLPVLCKSLNSINL